MNMKMKLILISLFVLFFIPPELSFAAPTVDVFRLTSSGQREDWPMIYKNTIYWLNPQGDIYGYNVKEEREFPLFEGEQSLEDLFAPIAFNGRYLVYNRLTDENSYDVSVYVKRRRRSRNITVTNEQGSQWATDMHKNTVIYIDGGACGKLYAYNLRRNKRTLITEHACEPAKIWGNIVVWNYAAPNGTNVYGYNLRRNRQFDIATGDGFQASPDIYKNYVVWVHSEGNYNAVYLKNLRNGKEKILHETSEYNISWPSISKRYVVWGKSTAQHVAGVEGVDLKTGEVFEIQEQGQHQNSNLLPIINGNIAAWMAWRTGNGDIYGAYIHK